MKTPSKTNQALIKELEYLRQHIAVLEQREPERNQEDEEANRMMTVVCDSNDAIIIQDFEGNITELVSCKEYYLAPQEFLEEFKSDR